MDLDSKDQDFRPTPAMKLYAFHKAKHGKKAKDSKLSSLGVAPETICRWKNIKGFAEWLEEEEAVYRAPIDAILEQKALEMIQKGDFRFWDAIAEKHSFKISPEIQSVFQLKYSLE